jgi:hypothetical protein
LERGKLLKFRIWVKASLLAAAALAAWNPHASGAQNDSGDNEDALIDGKTFSSLAAQWWQFVFSIPSSVNPTTDQTGANCMVGQRGGLWFLAGGSATRNCVIPEGKTLFFPIINNFQLNAPGVCGQDVAFGVEEARQMAKAATDSVTSAFATFDGQPLRSRREASKVFDATFPDDNIFKVPCGGAGGFPAGVYSPGVDDGYYAIVDRLRAGTHVLHIHGEEPNQPTQDVLYNLTVVPVRLK